MTLPETMKQPLKQLVSELVSGNFSKLEADGRAGRLTSRELQQVITKYGRALVNLPDEAFHFVEVYPIDSQDDIWMIDLDLWVAKEGRSDLTLSVMAKLINGVIEVEINDLHVL